MWKLISAMQLDQEQKEQKPMLLIDIRNSEDYAAGHISGAVNVQDEMLSEYLTQLPEGRNIVLICYLGPHSIRAARRLSEEGYDVSAVCGGMEAWDRVSGR